MIIFFRYILRFFLLKILIKSVFPIIQNLWLHQQGYVQILQISYFLPLRKYIHQQQLIIFLLKIQFQIFQVIN